jgi:hypothetical protein
MKMNEEITRTIYFSHQIRPPETALTMNGRNVPFVNSVIYFRLIFDKRITWRLYIETGTTKAYRTFIKLYSVFKSECLSTCFKLTLSKAVIKSVMTCAFPTWEFTAGTHLMKLQQLQNKVLCTIDKFTRNAQFEICIMFFLILYVNDFITKLCRQKARVIQNHKYSHI